ncbi:MAG: peptidoglycan DD-metalloendopeptidase family protein [Bacteroidaceae bacterium]|nr:peptidoglycan DD-metalloendopeptidase family protein [Bacteroidaceae bacterium]
MSAKRIIFIMLLFSVACAAWSQQKSVKEMRSRVSSLQQQIKEKERILLSSEKDVASKLKNLNLLTARVEEQKSLVSLLSKEVTAIDKEIAELTSALTLDEAQVKRAQDEYAAALRRARRYGSLQDKLLFIISADNFNSLLHRYRYTREYMNAHRKLADQLKEKIKALEEKRAEVEKVRASKIASLEEQKKEQQTLKGLEEKQRGLVAELKRENKKVQKELTRQRKELNNLNAAIEREIEREIEARRKAELAAAQKKKEADAKKKDTASKKGGNAVAKKTTTADEPAPKVQRREKEVVNPNSKGMQKLTGSFEQNKGRLPSPITGPCMVVGSFGPQRGVEGKGNVRIDYGGITLQGERGAKARAVFKGVVTSVVRAGDFAFVIVRHGKYLTVYCKLQNIKVSQGDEVNTGDILADVATDVSGATTLLFQIRNEKVKLNPRPWLKL